jgi:hypothetical protein
MPTLDDGSEPAEEVVQPVRRARGYAPFPITLPFPMRRIFAAGPLLKNTFCLTRDGYAFLSQHIGDIENLETMEHYEPALATYQHLFRQEPEQVVCDLHPDYLTTHFARQFAAEHGLPKPLRCSTTTPTSRPVWRTTLGTGCGAGDRCGVGRDRLWRGWEHLGW